MERENEPDTLSSRSAADGAVARTAGDRGFWPRSSRLERGDTAARALRQVTAIGLSVAFLWITLKVDLVIFAGVLLAICLRRSADRLDRLTGIGGGWSLAVVVLLILAGLGGIGWVFSASIVGQIDQLSTQLPTAFDKVAGGITHSGFGEFLAKHFGSGSLNTSPLGMLKGVFGFAFNAAEVVGGIAVIAFLGLYFAAEARLYRDGLLRLVAPARRPRAAQILHETADAIWYWLLGRLAAMVTLGALVGLGLWVLGVPLPAVLGLLAALLVFVPYVGSALSAVPSVVLAAATSLSLALWVIVLYIGIHLVEGYVLVPLVQRRVVHLPPALTLSAQLLFGMLAGLLGLLFATPLVAAAMVLVRTIYVEDILGERSSRA